ncbi:uncharacterized protein I303_105109 [Kwoniella dejecticola CBS 10117]|uniref:Uncharacterized protein n=1 Tax=Kwoniella dejecticola CBS 10117 TaxID=1296121 RepID=A0A1A6A3F1_9TREE|nr:uncharacterized protein I303_05446 [Kwoniella dejecticola CBS 10117]OBR84587.1 hypothetical protein I303_05446 [Kwoniella dejecticola CBS 10117]
MLNGLDDGSLAFICHIVPPKPIITIKHAIPQPASLVLNETTAIIQPLGDRLLVLQPSPSLSPGSSNVDLCLLSPVHHTDELYLQHDSISPHCQNILSTTFTNAPKSLRIQPFEAKTDQLGIATEGRSPLYLPPPAASGKLGIEGSGGDAAFGSGVCDSEYLCRDRQIPEKSKNGFSPGHSRKI